MWVPTTSASSSTPWAHPNNSSSSAKLRPPASTYESNGTVFFVHKSSGEAGAKSKISEREAVTPSGQRIFILPRAVNAEFHLGGMDEVDVEPQCKQ